MKVIAKALLLFLLLGVIFYKGAATTASLALVSRIESAFALPILMAKNFIGSNSFGKQIAGLEIENKSLEIGRL